MGSAKEVAQRSPEVGVGSASLVLEQGGALIQRVSERTGFGTGVVVGLFLLILVAVFAILVLGGLIAKPGDKWTMSSSQAGQDLLYKPMPAATVQDSRVPLAQEQALAAAKPVLPGAGASSAPVLPAGKSSQSALAGLLSQMSAMGASPTGAPANNMHSVGPGPKYLVPEMVVQEPTGAQFFMDGLLTSKEQNCMAEVWRITGDADNAHVMHITFCEGITGREGHHNGIVLELPRMTNMPISFINTQFATVQPQQGHHALSRNRHCTIFDTFSSGMDFKSPFGTVEIEQRGATLRRVNGDIECIVTSGGYNTDFGNIVDEQGRLLATLSNRGHALTGLGMVRGPWTENRRTIQVAEGVDVSLVIVALICAAKLS